MVFAMLLNFAIGLVSHITLYPVLERNYKPKTARLIAYVIGIIIDLVGSWVLLRAYSRAHGDRRKQPLAFERYVVVRFLSASAIGLGVVTGYLLDED